MNKLMNSTRRDFLQSTSGLLGLAFAGFSFEVKKTNPLFSFSTLGCPKWSFDTILNFAAEHKYKGIEIRGILNEMDLTKCPEFSNATQIKESLKKANDKGIKIVGLGASANMHIADPVLRKTNLDEAKRFIDLAQQLNCPNVRVFPNDLPKEQDRDKTIELIINGLLELGKYAEGKNVNVLLESHGKVVGKEILSQIMQAAKHPQIGLIWDVVNMWTVTKETPTEVHDKLKQYIRHVHIKDVKIVDEKLHYVRIGQGEAPLAEAITALEKNGYKGYYSFEWEKRWHPEIEEPEAVFPDYPKAMKKYF
ncbi:sugar phosphate isomerase/epimerase family protein [Runella aurantiaca]|uniref:Sugar phosphate isomerase/epimerase n=1 Tax=Runella aurantiaca TaxID=2282308 RepID=A0A369HYT7_9BACT|nr:sugar phosphate isomerase/epimerase family protein [Runella aurantiaca]RDB02518.1 sugar phosphate isomerase/epimerase [Runella aurantiaca]